MSKIVCLLYFQMNYLTQVVRQKFQAYGILKSKDKQTEQVWCCASDAFARSRQSPPPRSSFSAEQPVSKSVQGSELGLAFVFGASPLQKQFGQVSQVAVFVLIQNYFLR